MTYRNWLFLAYLLLGVFQAHLLYAQEEDDMLTIDSEIETLAEDTEEVSSSTPNAVIAALLSYKVVDRLPHRRTAFTQGLIVDNNILTESSGGYGRSSLSKVNLRSGKILVEEEMPQNIFAEGVARVEDSLYQLSFRSGILRVYDASTLQFQKQYQYDGEGWGITYDGENLIMSDGTDILRYMDREDFKEVERISVTENGYPLRYLNELEWVDGKVYANVWLRNKIVIIDPETGVVESYVDLKELLNEVRAKTKTGVLNGIAYDAKNDKLYVTGKNWPTLFEVKIEF